MTRTIANQFVSLALAALMALGMLSGTNALASHQYRVAGAAQLKASPLALQSQQVVVVGRRIADV